MKSKEFVSDLDKLISEYQRTHKLTPSQLAEIEKHKEIADLRDNPMEDVSLDSDMWDR